MRFLPLLLIAALCACSTGVDSQNRFDPDAPQEGQAKARISGRVLLEGPGVLNDSEVSLEGSGRSTTTDAEGRFELDEITPGVHVFRVSRDGYRSLRLPEVELRIGDSHDLGDITLRLTSGSLRGKVTVLAPGAAEQRGVTVVARPTGGPGAIGVTATVADGSWQIDDLVEGDYEVAATRDGFAPAAVSGVSVRDGEVGDAPDLTLVAIDSVLTINGGAAFTNTREVALRIEAPGSQQMRIGEQLDLSELPFEPYRERVPDYRIASPEDGTKTLYVQLRDAQDQVGQVYAAAIVLDTIPPGPVDVLINGGADFMTARDGGANITLQAVDAGSGVRRMRVAVGDDASAAPPQDFVAALSLPLGQEEGPKQVTVIYEDAAGNVSDPVSDSIVLDYTPPVLGSPAILVDGQADAARACDVDVFLTLQVEDAVEMKLANQAGLDLVPWSPFTPGLLWRLEGGSEDGPRQIHALFRDGAGNVTDEAVVVPVTLDRSGRISGRVLLEGLVEGELEGTDVVVTSSLGEVTSTVTDTDGSFGPVAVRGGGYSLSISRPGFATFVEPFATIAACTEVALDDIELPRATGTVRGRVALVGETDFSNVQIRISTLTLTAVSALNGEFALSGVPVGTYEITATRDGFTVGVASSVLVAPNRTVDVGVLTLAPASGDFLIDGGRALTASRDVTIEISATTSQPSELRVSEDPTFDDPAAGDVDWRPFAASLPFRLQDAQGLHEVFVQFRDTRGVASRPFSSSITLDSVAPEVLSMQLDGGAAWTRDAQARVTLELEVSDATSGAASVRIAVDDGALGDPVPLAPAIVLPLGGDDGLRQVRAVAVDRAGNESEAARAEISLDRQAPSALEIVLTGAGAAGVTRERAVDATLSATGANAYALQNGAANCNVLTYRTLLAPPENVVPHTLTEGNGEKIVRACFRDEAGNTAFVDGRIELDTLPPQDPSISAVEGPVVNSHEVTLALSAEGAATVLLSQDDPRFSGALPVTMADNLPFTLAGEDGPLTLYARFFDAAGNGSETVSYRMLLQTSAPDIGLVIDLDAATTNSDTGRVELLFFSAEAPESFRVSEQADFRDAEFEPFVQERVFFLSPGDGEKTVYAQFQFPSGNVRDASDSIRLDTRIGGGACAIGQETGFTNDREITVRVFPQDDDIAAMKVGFAPALVGRVFEAVEGDRPQLPLSLLGGDGPKSVYILMRDLAGNVSAAPLVCRTVLDTLAPQRARVEVAGGQVFTNRRDVVLSLAAQDRNGIHRVRVANDPSFEPHEVFDFATNLPWLLSDGDGVKTVYVELSDPAGNAVVVSDEIELDGARPPAGFVNIAEGEFVRNTVVTLELDSALAAEFEVTGDLLGAGSGAGNWFPMAPTHLVNLVPAEGGKLISVSFRDAAGGLLGLVQTRTVLDLNDPEITLVRLFGQSFTGEDDRLTGTRDVQVEVLASDGPGSGATELKISDSADFLDSGFVLFTPGDRVGHTLPESSRAFEDMVVFVKVRDRAGRESEPRSARITLDLRPPQVIWDVPVTTRGDGEVGVAFTFEGDPFDIAAFELEARAPDSGELLATQSVRRELLDLEALASSRFTAAWSIVELPAGETVEVLVRALDAAGNRSGDSPAADAEVAGSDDDGDGVLFADDNCPDFPNADQLDSDGDGLGDVCDELDLDDDRILNVDDNCPTAPNPDQADLDGDELGDACDEDIDGDGYSNVDEDTANQSNVFDPNSRPFDLDADFVSDLNDNCAETPNTDQLDLDGDLLGDLCDLDDDGDGYADLDELLEGQSDPADPDSVPPDVDEDFASDLIDNCLDTRNSSQIDSDEDGLGDRCDLDDDGDGYADLDEATGNQSDPLDPLSLPPDADGDFVSDRLDNCPDEPNRDQLNNEGDAFGDACDPDDDNDGFLDADELFEGQSDPFNPGVTPPDADGDLVSDLTDNCPSVRNPGQENADADPQGDACDVDRDNDAVPDQVELLAGTSPDDAQDFPVPQLVLEQIVAPVRVAQGEGLVPLTLIVRNAGLLELRELQAVVTFESLDDGGAVVEEVSADFVTSASIGNASTLPALVRSELAFFVEVAGDAFKGDVAVTATLSAVAGIGDVFTAADDARTTRRIWTVQESVPVFERVQIGDGDPRTQSVLLTPGTDAAPTVLTVEITASDSDGTVPTLTVLPRDRFGAPLPAASVVFTDFGDGTARMVFTHSVDTPGLTPERSPFRLTFRARDFEDLDTFAEWPLLVALENTNAAPFFTAFADTHLVGEREPLSFVVQAIDPEGGTPTLRAEELPAGATFTDNGDGSGRLDFFADDTQGGATEETYVFDIVATDPDQVEVETRAPVTITVANQPFIAPLGAVFPALEEQAFVLNVDARDPAGFHPALSLASTADREALGDKVTFVDNRNGTGTFTFTPEFLDSRDTPYGFRVDATLGGRVDSRDFGVEVDRLQDNDLVDLGITRISADDRAFDDGDIIIDGGTVRIDGRHVFRNVVVRNGGVLTHSPATDDVEDPTPYDSAQTLELHVTGVLTVEAGCAIDVSAKGFAGAQVFALDSAGFTVGNTRTGGSAGLTGGVRAAGGSHGGQGGRSSEESPGERYGNPLRPALPGSGGGRGSVTDGAGGAGGGVVRIFARLINLSGEIRADGAEGQGSGTTPGGGGGGAGGSILLAPLSVENGGDGRTLELLGPTSGSASITANGGVGGASTASATRGGNGGGGRVAIHASSVAANITVDARGGVLSGYAGGDHGTVLRRDSTAAQGNLHIIRNGNRTQSYLPGRGEMHITAVDGAVVTVDRPLPMFNDTPQLVGAFLVPMDTPAPALGLRILAHDASSFTLAALSDDLARDADVPAAPEALTEAGLVVGARVVDSWRFDDVVFAQTNSAASTLNTAARLHLVRPPALSDGTWSARFFRVVAHDVAVPEARALILRDGRMELLGRIETDAVLRRVTLANSFNLTMQELTASELIDVSGGAILNTRRVVSERVNVLSGAILRPRPVSLIAPERIDVFATHLFVDEGGQIRSWGTGYAGGSNPNDATTDGYGFGDLPLHDSRGCHGSSVLTGSEQPCTPYGNVFWPVTPGAGSSGSTGSAGSGAIGLHVSSTLLVDGAISANATGSGGAAGSVLLDLMGTGQVLNSDGAGSISASFNNGSGGGSGRIAVVDYIGTFPEQIELIAHGRNGRGGAGSIFLREAAATFGDLLLDNDGLNPAGHGAWLTPLGGGSIDAVSGNTLTLTRDSAVSFPVADVARGVDDLFRRWIEITLDSGDPLLAQVTANDATSLTLSPLDGAPLEGRVSAGARWRGIYPFRSVISRGRGGMQSSDPVVIFEVPEANAGAFVLEGLLNADIELPPGMTSLTFRGGEFFDVDASALPPVVHLESATVEVRGPVVGDEVSLTGGSVLQPIDRDAAGNPQALIVRAARLTVDTTSSLNADQRGYSGGFDGPGFTVGNVPGAGAGGVGSQLRVGGAYGGLPQKHGDAELPEIYGDFRFPNDFGSGGGADDEQWGGHGGGLIIVEVTERLMLDGTISADGGGSSTDGAGSGGGIRVDLMGTGTYESRSGAAELRARGGNFFDGGGGRIAVLDFVGEEPGNVSYTARGGVQSTVQGGPGTIYVRPMGARARLELRHGGFAGAQFPTPLLFPTDLPLTSIDGATLNMPGAELPVADGVTDLLGLVGLGLRVESTAGELLRFEITANTANGITVADPDAVLPAAEEIARVDVIGLFSSVLADEGAVFELFPGVDVSGELRIDGNAELTTARVFAQHVNVVDGVLFSPPRREEDGRPVRLHIRATDVSVGNGGSINADGRGYVGSSGRSTGFTLGNVLAPTGQTGGLRTGGSYGGVGNLATGDGVTYGNLRFPSEHGSGGGSDTGGTGGDGGGLVVIEVSGTFSIDGLVSANGVSGVRSGGSGGGIRVDFGGTGQLVVPGGAATIRANGGTSNVEGGGGRVALLDYQGAFPDELVWEAKGGAHNTERGGAGTLFHRPVGARGSLVLNGHGSRNHIATPIAGPLDLVPEAVDGSTLTLTALAPLASATDYVAMLEMHSGGRRFFNVSDQVQSSLVLELEGETLPAVSAIHRVQLLHAFDSVTFSNDVVAEIAHGLDVLGAVTLNGAHTLTTSVIRADRILVGVGAEIQPRAPGDDGWPHELRLEARTVDVEANAALDAGGLGWPGGEDGPGLTEGGVPGAPEGTPGCYGGRASTGEAMPTYGDFRFPNEFGAGGGSSGIVVGGAGGGRVVVVAEESFVFDGTIDAGGGLGGSGAPPGAGGAVRIELGPSATLSSPGARGEIRARGATGTTRAGGGRVAVLGGASAPTGVLIEARGGGSGNNANNATGGTVFIRPDGETLGSLVVSASLQRPSVASTRGRLAPFLSGEDALPTGLQGTVLIDDAADFLRADASIGAPGLAGMRVVIQTVAQTRLVLTIADNDATSLTLEDPGGLLPGDVAELLSYRIVPAVTRFEVEDEAGMDIRPGLIVPADPTRTNDAITVGVRSRLRTRLLAAPTIEIAGSTTIDGPQAVGGLPRPLRIEAEEFSLGASSVIDLDGLGWPGNRGGPGITDGGVPGAGADDDSLAGGSHGGLGELEVRPAAAFGDFRFPNAFGSSGASSGVNISGGGGGLFIAEVTGAFTLNGTIRADGTNSGSNEGDASGGSIRIDLRGTGSLLSTAGEGALSAKGAPRINGGGGRVAILDYVGALPLLSLEARGGSNGSAHGGAGTLFTRQVGTAGALTIRADSESPNLTPLRLAGVVIDSIEVEASANVCTPDIPDAAITVTVEAGSTFNVNDPTCQ